VSAGPAPGRPAQRAQPAAGSAGHGYRRGVVPRLSGRVAPSAAPDAGAGRASSGAGGAIGPVLRYGGGTGGIGVTTGHPKVYIVFWGSQWGPPSAANGILTLAGDPSGMAPYLQKLFKGLGTGGELWSGVVTQFCQGVPAGATSCPAGNRQHVGYPSGGALAGVWADEAGQAPQNATGHGLAAEAVAAAAHFGNSSASKNRNAQYLIVSPAGTHPDGFNTPSGNFCGWHDWTGDKTLPGGPVTSPYGHIAFTNLPYITDAGPACGQAFVNRGAAGRLDGVSLVAGHEYAETLTDQNPPGGWTDSAGDETADLCEWSAGHGARSADLTLSTGTFAMQPLFAPAPGGGTCEFSHAVVADGAGGKPRHRLRVTSPGRQRTRRGTEVRLRIRARDSAPRAALRYTGSGLPAGLRIGPRTGLITGQPSRAGTFRVRIRVRDRSGAAGSAAFTWMVTDPAAAVLASLLSGQAGYGQWIVWADAQAADIRAAAGHRA
ncbi:MAG: Ig domain-containing protein, partial [Streptosporangiaceae bacterium]